MLRISIQAKTALKITSDAMHRLFNVPKKPSKVKNKINKTTPRRVTPPIAIASQQKVREGELIAVVITPPKCDVLNSAYGQLDRNLEGIMHPSRIP
jgi:hypothetical protein